MSAAVTLEDPRALAAALGIGATVTLLVLMNGRLEGPGTRGGIIDLELAGSVQRATTILENWSERGVRSFAGKSLLLDQLLIASYSLGLCALYVLIASGQSGYAQVIGFAVAWMALAAGVLDLVEDAALVIVLAAPAVHQPWPRVSQVAASVKFLLLTVGVAYLLAVAVAWLRELHTAILP